MNRVEKFEKQLLHIQETVYNDFMIENQHQEPFQFKSNIEQKNKFKIDQSVVNQLLLRRELDSKLGVTIESKMTVIDAIRRSV